MDKWGKDADPFYDPYKMCVCVHVFPCVFYITLHVGGDPYL
jgi:hypothetical protein